MVRIQTRSLHFRITSLLILLILSFSVLTFYNNYSAFSLLRKSVRNNAENRLVLYQKHLDDSLGSLETYLYTIALNNNDLLTLKFNDMHTTVWFSALYRLQADFQNALSIYTTDGLFCYLPEAEQFIFRGSNGRQPEQAIKSEILTLHAREETLFFPWTILEVEGNRYLLRILNIDGVYVGTWVGLNTLLDSLVSEGKEDSQLYFATGDGILVDDIGGISTLTEEDYIEKNGLIVSRALETEPFYLTLLIPRTQISDYSNSLITVILIVSFSLLLVWFLLFILLRKWILSPILMLTHGIQHLRNGDLDIFVPIANQSIEFQNMTSAFNDMVSEIKDLKIDIYESKLQRQRLEAQYLKQQIAPHFLINCLSTAWNLMEMKCPELAGKMLKDLSLHLRYTLSSHQTVTLEDELEQLKNYIELSEIRYPKSISLHIDCSSELNSATVIPLLLLNFAENTIKYEVVMGQILELHIVVSAFEREGEVFLHICIWDTGNGFSPEILQKLRDIDSYLKEEHYRIGIVNVILRARQAFRYSRFTFTNRLQAGAQIDIELPLIL